MQSDRTSSERAQAYRLPLTAAAIERGHSASFIVRGRSMWPALQPGDRVFVRALSTAPRVGEIVVCSEAGRETAHRIVQLGRSPEGETLVTCRGDTALSLDAPIPIRRLLGRIERIERAGRAVRLLPRPAWTSRILAHLRPILARLRAQ